MSILTIAMQHEISALLRLLTEPHRIQKGCATMKYVSVALLHTPPNVGNCESLWTLHIPDGTARSRGSVGKICWCVWMWWTQETYENYLLKITIQYAHRENINKWWRQEVLHWAAWKIFKAVNHLSRGQEFVELYLHSPIRLHGVVLS
jgi:hypothetical protein